MFGISLTEVAMIALVALVVVGPQKLPGMLRTLGEWVRRVRQMTNAVRVQTGIDDILRQEGIDGGLAELRSLVRGDLGSLARARRSPRDQQHDDPYETALELDRFREYPLEGVDAAGTLPDDLVDEPEDSSPQPIAAAGPPPALAEPAADAPAASEAAVTEPAVAEPAVSEPAVSEPAADAPATDAQVERSSTRAPWQTDREK